MNNNFKSINIEDILFFDTEVVRKNKELDPESKEFELYRKKIRNKDTDELPSVEDTLKHYEQFAGLKLTFNKTVCISVGAVKKGVLYLNSYIGEEKDVIESFYKKSKEYQILAGWNILGYDLPTTRINSLRHGDIVKNLPERFIESGKKPWNLEKSIVDLMDYFKGTFFYNTSLDEACDLLELPSPKEGGIDGSQVSKVFYDGGIEDISLYCKRDVLSVVNVFLKMRFEEIFTDFVDINDKRNKIEKEAPAPFLQRLYIDKRLTDEVKAELQSMLVDKDITDFDRENLIDIILSVYIDKKDKVGDKKVKRQEVEEFIKSL